MKKLIAAILLLTMIIPLSACSERSEVPIVLDKEGIAPYPLSQSERYLLQSFNIEDTSQIISFHAPKEAISLNVNVYRLQDGAKWTSIGGGAISIGADRKPIDQLTGTFTMQLKENYAVDFVINAGGLASYTTEEITLDSEILAFTKGFLQDFQDIAINTEIPVAFMAYSSGANMTNCALEDFFDPSEFADMDLVQVVTLEFSDQ